MMALDAAVEGARAEEKGNAWFFSRPSSYVDISPLLARVDGPLVRLPVRPSSTQWSTSTEVVSPLLVSPAIKDALLWTVVFVVIAVTIAAGVRVVAWITEGTAATPRCGRRRSL